MPVTIKNRWSGETIATVEDTDDLREAVIRLVKQGVSLNDADLYRASLDGASLVGARLVGASLDRASLVGARLDRARLDGASLDRARLDGASLDGASLVGASLDGASLDGASLVGARLDGASLVGARLDRARLDGASLVGARLDGASLVGAILDSASLVPIRNDMWAVLTMAPLEVPALIAALNEGRVDGSAYEGECACLVGTIANARKCSHDAIEGLEPDSSRPAECFFMGIKKGDTPETNQVSKLARDWSLEWYERMQKAFGPVEAAAS